MRMNTEFWRGKTVLITGASSGIGQAIAEVLAPSGARIGLLGRDAERLTKVAEQCRERGAAMVATARCDIVDCAATSMAVRELETQLGPCDVMIASAGIHRFSNALCFDAVTANEVIATNVGGVFSAFGAVLPGMVTRNRGHLVAISSIAGIISLPMVAAYSAGKAAVNTACRSLRTDLRHTQVGITTVLPGFVDTPLLGDHDRSNISNILKPQDVAERILRAVERRRDTVAFPFKTWLMAWIADKLPQRLYNRMWDSLIKVKRKREDARRASK